MPQLHEIVYAKKPNEGNKAGGVKTYSTNNSAYVGELTNKVLAEWEYMRFPFSDTADGKNWCEAIKNEASITIITEEEFNSVTV